MKGVYLLHFERPYKHARHYLGYSKDIEGRLEEHRKGCGARLLFIIKEAGIGFVLARVWKGKSRKWERKLKDSHNVPRYCPLCKKKI